MKFVRLADWVDMATSSIQLMARCMRILLNVNVYIIPSCRTSIYNEFIKTEYLQEVTWYMKWLRTSNYASLSVIITIEIVLCWSCKFWNWSNLENISSRLRSRYSYFQIMKELKSLIGCTGSNRSSNCSTRAIVLIRIKTCYWRTFSNICEHFCNDINYCIYKELTRVYPCQ